uniref:hypothetical protein n=1 Tax=unclassified Rhodococcus (in: high G+C Gram-positive bacteria) TaxID=192944 RepID=UPI0011402D0E|nr:MULTISPECIES: hypothetical protein [unclassified Rhodococcus (in: high G+C Gram-positive bacteria)]
MNTVVAEHLRLTWDDCAPKTRAVHVGISGRHRDPVKILAASSSTVFVRFLTGELREVHPADLARDPKPQNTITTHSTNAIGNARVEVETYRSPETLTEPAQPTVHGVYVECSEVLELERAREMRDALICAVRDLERLQGN